MELDPILVEFPDCKPYHLVPSMARARQVCRVLGYGLEELSQRISSEDLDVAYTAFCVFAGCETDRQREEAEARMDAHGYWPALVGLGRCIMALRNRLPGEKAEAGATGKP